MGSCLSQPRSMMWTLGRKWMTTSPLMTLMQRMMKLMISKKEGIFLTILGTREGEMGICCGRCVNGCVREMCICVDSFRGIHCIFILIGCDKQCTKYVDVYCI